MTYSLHMDDIHLDESEKNIYKEKNSARGKDENVSLTKEDPTVLEETKVVITHRELMVYSSVNIRVIKNK